MTIADWLMILAVLAAPMVAVQVQRYVESVREHRRRRHDLFQTLMCTRTSGARLSNEHVRALNMIELEFSAKPILGKLLKLDAEQDVLDSWRLYFDHLNTPSASASQDTWNAKSDDLFVELLYEMARSLGYSFDKVYLKNVVYFPQAHGILEEYQRVGQEWFVQLMTGRTAIPVRLTEAATLPTEADVRRTVQQLPSQKTNSGDGSDGISPA